MKQTDKELEQYKVIADYPDSPFSVGDVLTDYKGNGWFAKDEVSFPMNSGELKLYPNLFQPLSSLSGVQGLEDWDKKFNEWKDDFYKWKEDYRRKRHKEPMAELVRDWIETNVINPIKQELQQLKSTPSQGYSETEVRIMLQRHLHNFANEMVDDTSPTENYNYVLRYLSRNFPSPSQGAEGSEAVDKRYKINFCGHVLCHITVDGEKLQVDAAMSGYGDSIPTSEITVTELPSI